VRLRQKAAAFGYQSIKFRTLAAEGEVAKAISTFGGEVF